MTALISRSAAILLTAFLVTGVAQARSLNDAFHPLFADSSREVAMICVKYGSERLPIDVLVDGRTDDPTLNAQMLTLLLANGRRLPPRAVVPNGWSIEAVDRTGAFAGTTVPEDPFRCPNQ